MGEERDQELKMQRIISNPRENPLEPAAKLFSRVQTNLSMLRWVPVPIRRLAMLGLIVDSFHHSLEFHTIEQTCFS